MKIKKNILINFVILLFITCCAKTPSNNKKMARASDLMSLKSNVNQAFGYICTSNNLNKDTVGSILERHYKAKGHEEIWESIQADISDEGDCAVIEPIIGFLKNNNINKTRDEVYRLLRRALNGDVDNDNDNDNVLSDENEILSNCPYRKTTRRNLNCQHKMTKRSQNMFSRDFSINRKGNQSVSIKSFIFHIKLSHVNIAEKLMSKECSIIYSRQGNPNPAEYKSLLISKGVDLKNHNPISLWLLDSFSRERIIGHKHLFNSARVSSDDYRFDADRYSYEYYNVVRWWLHNSKYSKYIEYKNSKMALPMMTAVNVLSNTALPTINFDPKRQSVPIIHDDLNKYVNYILASWGLVYNLTKCMKEIKFTPIQFDFWIIPELTKEKKINRFSDNLQELSTNRHRLTNNSYTVTINNLINGISDNLQELSTNKCCAMTKDTGSSNPKCHLWDLEECLKKDGYVRSLDYWCDYIENDSLEFVEQKINDMIFRSMYGAHNHKNICLLVNRFLLGIYKYEIIPDDILNIIHSYMDPYWIVRNISLYNNKQYRRYIYIIDRRNPKNLQNKDMSYAKEVYCNSSKDWQDKIYLIRPRIYGKISKHFMDAMEVFLGYSKGYLFPNTEGSKSAPIGITDTLNGYNFVLSYHLLKHNLAKAYWYVYGGGQRFELEDIEWLWGRFFAKINGQEQLLNKKTLDCLHMYSREKILCDNGFCEFWEQSHRMPDIRRRRRRT